MAEIPHVLSVAGSDPSGGAGIQADLKTFHAMGAYGMAVVTSLTAQNTRGVTGIHDPPPEFVAAQLAAVLDDVRVDAAKTGMLKTAAVIEVVAGAFREGVGGRLVVDPVMVATSGDRLIDDDAVEALRALLFPLAALVTPNREEAEVLLGDPVRDLPGASRAARAILREGAGAVLVKGIRDSGDCVDLLVTPAGEREFRHPEIAAGTTHGTGCTLSAALAAGLARGLDLAEAAARAVAYVARALRCARPVGRGGVPLNHLVRPPELP